MGIKVFSLFWVRIYLLCLLYFEAHYFQYVLIVLFLFIWMYEKCRERKINWDNWHFPCLKIKGKKKKWKIDFIYLMLFFSKLVKKNYEGKCTFMYQNYFLQSLRSFWNTVKKNYERMTRFVIDVCKLLYINWWIISK